MISNAFDSFLTIFSPSKKIIKKLKSKKSKQKE